MKNNSTYDCTCYNRLTLNQKSRLSLYISVLQIFKEVAGDDTVSRAWKCTNYSALIWQKEASDKSDISRKRAKCVCHLHWRQWNIRMSYLTDLLVGWLFLHEIWPGRKAHYVNYENINNSNLDGMSLASFCQSRAVLWKPIYFWNWVSE